MGNSLPVTSKFTDGEENDRIKYAVSSMQGFGEKMEDAYAAILNLDDTTDTSFFGVYDGHGGADVASYCARQFHVDLRNHEDYHNDVTNAMKSVFFSMDEKLQQSDEWRELVNPRGTCCMCANLLPCSQFYAGPAFEGSTVSAVLIRGNRIIVGNVGDSRCVLSRNGQAIDLSIDHKPESFSEIERVEKSGGRFAGPVCKKILGRWVIKAKAEWGFYDSDRRVTVSRAIGDFAFKQNKYLPPAEQMLICNPDIRTVGITDDAEFLLIASAGIWDCISSQDAVDFIRERLQSEDGDLRAICEDLLNLGLLSGDNTTAILVWFKTSGYTDADADADADAAADANAAVAAAVTAAAAADGEADAYAAEGEADADDVSGSDGYDHDMGSTEPDVEGWLGGLKYEIKPLLN